MTTPSGIDFSSVTPEVVTDDTDEFPTPDFRASRNGKRTKPPRKTAPPEQPKLPPKRKGQFIQPLTNLYGGIGMALAPIDPVCGQAVLVSAENCARTLDELAYQNEAVRRVLWSLTTTSAYGAVFIAHMPIMLAVLTHHMPGFAMRLQDTGVTIAQSAAEAMQQNLADNEPPAESSAA